MLSLLDAEASLDPVRGRDRAPSLRGAREGDRRRERVARGEDRRRVRGGPARPPNPRRGGYAPAVLRGQDPEGVPGLLAPDEGQSHRGRALQAIPHPDLPAGAIAQPEGHHAHIHLRRVQGGGELRQRRRVRQGHAGGLREGARRGALHPVGARVPARHLLPVPRSRRPRAGDQTRRLRAPRQGCARRVRRHPAHGRPAHPPPGQTRARRAAVRRGEHRRRTRRRGTRRAARLR